MVKPSYPLLEFHGDRLAKPLMDKEHMRFDIVIVEHFFCIDQIFPSD